MDAGHERFIVELGLDRGVMTETEDGWRVRYERQLVRPAKVGWRVLAAEDDLALGGQVPSGFAPTGLSTGTITGTVRKIVCER